MPNGSSHSRIRVASLVTTARGLPRGVGVLGDRVYVQFDACRGVIEKHTDAEPFDVPDPVLAAEGDLALPVNFLADADTTGGNCGSPVVNGRGELVGVNFDRVRENVANDFAYNPDIARNISADVRYLLWMLRDLKR